MTRTATNANRTATRFASIINLAERAGSEGERKAALAAAKRMVTRKGLSACAPSHPLATVDGFYFELLDAVKACMNSEGMDSTIAWYALGQFSAKELARATAMIRARQRKGWNRGRWTGGSDLKFLNVAEWGFEQAAFASAESEGWTRDEVRAYTNRQQAMFADMLAEM